MGKGCVFCDKPDGEKIFSDDFVYACLDKNPVSRGHVLIITNRHIKSWFDMSIDERDAVWAALLLLRDFLDEKFAPHGYNIGINSGIAAGQTIDHLHIHLIPRYLGDIDDPQGGVRGVIPEKRIYQKGGNRQKVK